MSRKPGNTTSPIITQWASIAGVLGFPGFPGLTGFSGLTGLTPDVAGFLKNSRFLPDLRGGIPFRKRRGATQLRPHRTTHEESDSVER